MLIGQKASARTLRRDLRGDRKNVAPVHAEGDNHDIIVAQADVVPAKSRPDPYAP